MNCTHCETGRRELREIAERHDVDVLPGWGQRPDVDADLAKRPFATVDQSALHCDCECHVPARIVGKLPRLSVS